MELKMRKLTAIALIGTLGLSACSNSPYAQNNGPVGGKTEIGTLIGAVGGGVAGAQFGKGKGQLVATAIGTLLGAAIGNQVGDSLDKADIMYHDRASRTALESARTGSSVDWVNPDTGHQGEVQITKTYQAPTGRYCREYNEKVSIGGKTQSAYGTACRQPDGSWQIASN
jgi:surface antigen